MFSLSKSLEVNSGTGQLLNWICIPYMDMVGCGHEMLSRESTSYPFWVGGAGADSFVR